MPLRRSWCPAREVDPCCHGPREAVYAVPATAFDQAPRGAAACPQPVRLSTDSRRPRSPAAVLRERGAMAPPRAPRLPAVALCLVATLTSLVSPTLVGVS